MRLDSLNVAWTNMSRDAVVYLVISLPPTVTRLNISGCRDTLQDEGKSQHLIVMLTYVVCSYLNVCHVEGSK